MSKLKWLALMPLLAAALVFGSGWFSEKGPTDGAARRAAPEVPDSWRSATRGNSTAESSPSLDMGELTFSLLAVLGLAVGAIFVLRRLQRGTQSLAPQGSIALKETRRLSAKRALHLVAVADRLLLLAEAEGGLSLVSDLTPTSEEDAPVHASLPVAQEAEPALNGAEPRDFVVRAQARPPQSDADQTPAALGNFRELLARLGQGTA